MVEWWIVLPILAGLLITAFISTIVYVCCRKCKKKNSDGEDEESDYGSVKDDKGSVRSVDDGGTVRSKKPEPAAPAKTNIRNERRGTYDESDGLYSAIPESETNISSSQCLPPALPERCPNSLPKDAGPPTEVRPPAKTPTPTETAIPADTETGEAVYSVVNPIERAKSRTLRAKRETERKRVSDEDGIAGFYPVSDDDSDAGSDHSAQEEGNEYLKVVAEDDNAYLKVAAGSCD